MRGGGGGDGIIKSPAARGRCQTDVVTVHPCPLPHTQFVTFHVHRVYVIESTETPRVVAVVTLTDILRLITA